ncbi:MAG: hypothetical protein H7641_08505 [Candidatus Heimdallarchaeota archaeon]|nr:hypothetical protein [Candidatus Heimdallarchaeota archaeon]MCK4877607.1 hypothetical protein [Candidatus Heimdallarchaeota archaeon]
MKVVFEPENKEAIFDQLQEIAEKYGTTVKQQDTGKGHFIFVKSKLKIVEKVREYRHRIQVWGAKDEDVNYLKQFWGEPIKKIVQKMTPLVFAKEIVKIPNVKELTIEDITAIMEISESDYQQYCRYIKVAASNASAPEEVVKADNLLENIS